MNLPITAIRHDILDQYLACEQSTLHRLITDANIASDLRSTISAQAAQLVTDVRKLGKPSMMEKFLAEYGLTTKEGVALMCLAEALLRVPDSYTIDALIEDKVSSGNWHSHLGSSNSSLVNSSTWALLLTGKVIAPSNTENEEKNIAKSIRSLVKKFGEPLVRTAVGQAMKELGSQFVLGRDINEACKRAAKFEKQGYSYSYDMLGEAARTEADALRYLESYSCAIKELSAACKHDDIKLNPGISVKLSALYSRYEYPQKALVLEHLVPRTLALAQQAKAANMGFNIDAEEADRLDLSLDVIEAVLADPSLQGWDGFGVVVQAFGQRASHVLDWLYALAQKLDRKIMVRLVKGAYWDAEIKRAQVLGLSGYPVFTRKLNSDVSYICCAKKLVAMTDRIYPQFATHNAHTVTAVINLASQLSTDQYEFQRLHGMGESLHHHVLESNQTRCRVYAPVGAHKDLLAYLVRRLLENGANSSFVNQIVDTSIKPEDIARDPIDAVLALNDRVASQLIPLPHELYGLERKNAMGWDITDAKTIAILDQQRAIYEDSQWHAGPIVDAGVAEPTLTAANLTTIRNPANPEDVVGTVRDASAAQVTAAIEAAEAGFINWNAQSAQQRAKCLNKLADLYELHAAEFFALATREAGKSLLDAIGELREAVDFARYYANQAITVATGTSARGVITCISPWNFPLAIFSGQVLAALAAGNAVLAKPAEQTVLIAAKAVQLMHQAGIPTDAVQLLPGTGAIVGAQLTSHPSIAGVCFTGSTATAQRINKTMAQNMSASAPLIAETGGLNAMIVDSTALPEQVVRDVLASAFQSAGQRCSALRMLYLQEDIADDLLKMLYGAMDQLHLGNPWLLRTDIGPVIDQLAKDKIELHCKNFEAQGKLLKTLAVPKEGLFIAPTVLKVTGIEELKEEIFGPILHVATFKGKDINKVVATINAQNYGLTFGIHSRVDSRVQSLVSQIKAGNAYVNRNQIGAIVGSQPFGGEGLSGTGPKAGGPHYLKRFLSTPTLTSQALVAHNSALSLSELQQEITALANCSRNSAWLHYPDNRQTLLRRWIDETSDTSLINNELLAQIVPPTAPLQMPGPTGELNILSEYARGLVLCLASNFKVSIQLALAALSQGNCVLMLVDDQNEGFLRELNEVAQHLAIPVAFIAAGFNAKDLISLQNFSAVASDADAENSKQYRIALAQRQGALLPLINETSPERYILERHLCVDTTAAGGNASLIATVED
ncbi:MAG: RHH-type proline utilization regulon transcriptional repressor/proline dehydrogenase [Oceanospirillaceae bacterium]|jgi:RHH-type proline utilization regulon transcriptional repressor/proline dehydrogenase/delta 1-pyrroline-5-carboxylate dehydrogenase